MKKIILLFLIALIPIIESNSIEEGIRLTRDSENLYLSLKIGFKNSKELQRRLSSGLSNKILISVQIKDKKSGSQIFNKEYIFEAIYDVWDEKYRLYFYSPNKNLIFESKDKEDVYKRFTNPENIVLCSIKLLSYESIYNVKVKIIINPVSKDIIEKIKEYLSDPETTNRGTPTRTIFGSFANTFIPDLNTENILKYEIKSINLSDITILE